MRRAYLLFEILLPGINQCLLLWYGVVDNKEIN